MATNQPTTNPITSELRVARGHANSALGGIGVLTDTLGEHPDTQDLAVAKEQVRQVEEHLTLAVVAMQTVYRALNDALALAQQISLPGLDGDDGS